MANDLQTNGNTQIAKPPTDEQKFGNLIEGLAKRELERIAATPQGKAAVARVALAFRAAAKSAADPSALYRCDAASVAACVVYSALYDIMPGGQFAGVYLVPKGGVLGWWLNHRGIIELARRSGFRVVAKPHFTFDRFRISYGLTPTLEHEPGKGDKSWDNLAGVYVIVFDAATGQALDYIDLDRDDIEARRRAAQTQGVWNKWPIEQAIKTAIKYAAARGIISFSAADRDVLDQDAEARDFIDTTAAPVTERKALPAPSSTEALDAALGRQPEPVARDEGEE